MKKNILRRLYHHLKVYMVLEIQLVIGFFLLLLFLNSYVCVKSRYTKLEEEGKRQEYVINMSISKDEIDYKQIQKGDLIIDDDNFPIQLSDIPMIEKMYNCSLELSMEKYVFILGLVQPDDKGNTTILYSNETDKAILTKSFYDMLINKPDSIVIASDFPYDIKDGFLYCGNEKIEIELIESDQYIARLPIRYYYKYFDLLDLYYLKAYINIDANNSSDMIHNMTGILSFLSENTYYTYNLSNDLYDFAALINTSKNESTIISIISVVMLFVILIGMGCIFIMIMDERKKELAICVAVGSSKIQVILEILAEVGTIIISSFGIAFLGCLLLVSYGFNFAGVIITMDVKINLILCGIAIVLTAIVTFPSAYKIYRFMPMEILKCE